MFFTRVIVSLFQFVVTVLMLAFGIFLTYRVIIRANPDFDMEEQIKKANVSVGVLVAGILLSASLIMQQVIFSVVSMFRIYMVAPPGQSVPLWQLLLIALGHVVMAFVLAIFTISVTLRMFGKLTRPRMHPGEELEKGNVAMGVLLAGVVLVAALYVSEAVSSVSKALIPQPSIGRIQVMK